MQLTFITQQRIILIWLLVIAFLLTMLRHRTRYVIIIPVGIMAIFTLGTIVFPLYQQGPDFTNFYKEQPSTVYFITIAHSTSKINIQNKTTKTELNAQTTTHMDLPKNLETTISFVASSTTGEENWTILLPEWSTISMRPQSQITFLSQYPKITINVKQGSVAILRSDNNSPRQFFLSGVSELDGLKNQFQQAFETQKMKSISNQTATIFMQNPYLKAINKWILDVLVRLRPNKFQESMDNFQAFAWYLPTAIIRTTDTTNDPQIGQDMANQASRWLEETQMYQRRKRLFH